MKKDLLSLFAFVCLLAQTAIGQNMAPNFTGTDINGNTHTLYDLLDEGKTVILDFSTTWCGPCWGYHTQHVLKDIYECYGPEKSDNIAVFFIESDNNTTTDDLYGLTAGSTGNWVEGTPYPIIDDASISSLYGVQGFPTLFTICPSDRIANSIYYANATFNAYKDIAFDVDCMPPLSSNDASLSCQTIEKEYCAESLADLSVSLFNGGAETLTEATIDVLVDGTVVETKNWSGALEPYQEETVTFNPMTIDEQIHVEFVVQQANDEVTANNYSSAILSVAPTIDVTNETITVNILTDYYAEETSWELLDENGTVIASGENYEDSNTMYSQEIALPVGCYSFRIYDTFGDGIITPGYYQLIDGHNNIFIEGDFFEMEKEHVFEKISTVSTQSLLADQNIEVNVFPNPVSDAMYIELQAQEKTVIHLEMTDVVGQPIAQKELHLSAGTQNYTHSTADLPAGIYFLTLSSDDKIYTQKIIKE